MSKTKCRAGRVGRFRELRTAEVTDDTFARDGGALTAASHDSYTACGLASDGTDLIVKLVLEAGPARGLYGAKITGSSSGGAVAILARARAEKAIEQVVRQYSELTGRANYLFRGSSAGACTTEVMQVTV